MRRIVLFFAVGLGGIALVEKLRGVETGDIDGDGYVTLADVASFLEGVAAAAAGARGEGLRKAQAQRKAFHFPAGWGAREGQKKGLDHNLEVILRRLGSRPLPPLN